MKLVALILCLAFIAGCGQDITEDVRRQANSVGFDYESRYDDARDGDIAAITQLINFTQHTDASGGLMHATYLFEVLHEVGDKAYTAGMKAADSKWREVAGNLLVGEGYWEFMTYRKNIELEKPELQAEFKRQYPLTASTFTLDLSRF